MPKKGETKAKAAESGEPKTFNIGDIVLGRIKGYPPWPAKVVDPDKEYLTKEVLKLKPAKKTTLLVKYYTDANYSWSPPQELQPLTPKAIETFLAGKKAGPLFKAYKTAQDPEEWEAQQEVSAEKARNASNNNDDDELDSEDEVESKPKDGKRKRKAAEPKAKDAGDKKKAKTEKKDTKAKAKPAKKSVGGGEDMSEGAVKCRDWRHKLQKAFLTKGLPSESDAPTYDGIFKEMEAFEHQAKWLVPSKLPKVVKRIATIKEDIPRDSEFNFKSRAAALVEKWKDSLTPEGEMDVDEKKADSTPAPAETNGDASAEKQENGVEEEKKAETAEADAPAETEEPAKADADMAVEPATTEA